MSPMDYFIFGYIKNQIYIEDPTNGITRPTTLDGLWARILQVWWSIPPATLLRIRASYRQNRIDKLVRLNGARFENERWISSTVIFFRNENWSSLEYNIDRSKVEKIAERSKHSQDEL